MTILDAPRLRGLLVGVAVLGCAVLAGAGCAADVTGSPTARPDAGSQPPGTSAGTPTGPLPSGSCDVTATSDGSISSSGAGGRTSTVNGRTSFSCGSGPMIGIEEIGPSGVGFSADGSVVTVAPGATSAVGAYRVSVVRVDGASARFRVEPSG